MNSPPKGLEDCLKSMKPTRPIVTACLGLLLLVAVPATPGVAGESLPNESRELLLVGDSVTAGIYFLSITNTSAAQAWAGQLMQRLGIESDRGHFEEPFPINHLGLARLGFTVGGLAYPWEALSTLLPRCSKFTAGDERVVMAVPGQMVWEVLEQSSKNKGKNSSGWTFAELLLPEGLSAMETIEQWSKKPRWVVLFIGANDLLASFGIVGDAEPPSPDVFRQNYRRLAVRLRGVMRDDAPPVHLLVLTLPDVTRLPMLQPVAKSAHDGSGNRFPAGSVASAFLIPFRNHFEPEEVWTPAELELIRQRVTHYNAAIRTVAADMGLTVVDVNTLMAELAEDPAFATRNSPYFSPDLHHPSFRTHGVIADAVCDAMAEVAGVECPPPAVSTETPLPHNGDFSSEERARVDAMVHLGLQGMKGGPLPPRPTYRLSVDVGGQAFEHAGAGAALALMIGIESTPSPISRRWLSRGGFHLRASPLSLDDDGDVEGFPENSLEARAGIAIEPIGGWHWTRLGAGVLWAVEGGFGGYLRGEWRFFYAEASIRDRNQDRIEAGLRWGWLRGRPGRNGN
jgi:lysophospholipase L1-like esterase